MRGTDGIARKAVVKKRHRFSATTIDAAKRAAVPQRVQIGSTCGLYALGMVMDLWHARDARQPTALVQDADLRGRHHTNFEPTTKERMLDVAIARGFTAEGEMFTAQQLAATARHFGYGARTHDEATLADLYKVLDRGHPAIVAFDVDDDGDAGVFGGANAHWAVIQGYFDDGGRRYLVARHGWGVQKDHVWDAADFDRSWRALRTTDAYGTPGDGIIPTAPKLREPRHMHLPDAGRGRARIDRSLARKIVEVVPRPD